MHGQDPKVPESTTTGVLQAEDGPLHVIAIIHGIRTTASWAEAVKHVFETADDGSTKITGVEAVPLRYGRLDLLRFWLPGPTRRKPITTVSTALRNLQGPGITLSVLAHSYGTYIVSKILAEDSDIKIKRLILCGSIVDGDYNWALRKGLAELPLNDCSPRDILPLFAKCASWGYGASGTEGFRGAGARNRYHPRGHSEYLEESFARRYWKPFFACGEIVRSDWEKGRPEGPSWHGWIPRLHLKWVLAVLVALFVYLGPVKVVARAFSAILSATDTIEDPAIEPFADGSQADLLPGVIAYISDDGSFRDLRQVNTDGTNNQVLRQNVHAVSYSASGSQIVYNTDSGLFIADSDGGNTRQLHATGFSPDWGPNDVIAFTDNDGSIWTINADGTRPDRVTAGGADRWPSWAPNGIEIAFVRRGPDGFELWVVDANRLDLRRLTSGRHDVSPDWGTNAIVFQRGDAFAESSDLYLINSDGSNLRIVPNTTYAFAPAWSPDGSWLSFTVGGNGGPLNVIRSDGTGVRSLVSSRALYSTWRP